jgi:putative ABC transport system permease protein
MEWIRILVSRCAELFGKGKRDAELDAELWSHIDLAAEENRRQGMPEAEARMKALRDFGGMAQAREQYRIRRGLPFIATIGQDLRFGFRQLLKSPSFALASILTLALGIGATTAIFSIVKAVLLAPLPYKDPGRIVAVWTTNPSSGADPMPSSAADYAIWKQRSGVFQSLAPSYDNEMTLTGLGAPQLLIGYAVSAEYLRILGVAPQLGRLYTNQEDQPGGPKVVLLSDYLWRTRFQSDANVVGRAITLNGRSYTVVGVMPRDFDYPREVEIWTPTAMDPSSFNDFDDTEVRILGRLRKGVSIAQAQKTLNAVEAQIAVAHPGTDGGNHVVLTPLREELVGDIREPLLILMGAVGLVLLIACANTAGLALARDAGRRKEIAVRLALGATRRRILRQFLTEKFLLAAMGGAAGMVVALAGTHFLLRLFPNDVANLNIPKVTHIPMSGGVFLFALAITLATALLFGIAPVMRAVRANPDAAIKESSRGSTTDRSSGRLRSILVVSEVALGLTLLSGAGLVVASFRKAADVSLGFQPDHLLSVQVFLPPDRYPSTDGPKRTRFVEDVMSRLRGLPGVRSAGAINFLPLSGFWGTTNFLVPGQAPPKSGQGPEADNRVITPGYLETMEIPLLRGRDFNAADRAGAPHVALINEKMARDHFAGRDPIGENLNLGSAEKPDWWRIVGIVGNVKAFGQDQPTHAAIYTSFAQQPFPIIAFTLRTETDPATMTRAAEEALWSVDPNLSVLKAIPVNVLAGQTLAIRRASSALISAFAVLALVLACIGIYGVMAYAAAQRTQEIGVRMALGAQRGAVLRMIMGMGARLSLIGIMIGLAGALAGTRLLATLLFETSAMDPLIFAAAVGLLTAVALAASWLPARRAASMDPMTALRIQ